MVVEEKNMNKKIALWFLGIMFVLTIFFGGLLLWYAFDNHVQVSFLDVGQGDAILVSRGSNQVLIDGGHDGQRVLERLGRALPFWDRTIETVIATHPDEDHVGGLVAVAGRYTVRQWIMTPVDHDTASWKFLEKAAEGSRLDVVRGSRVVFSDASYLEVLYPFANTVFDPRDTNDGSVVTKLHIGPHTFLLTGDLPVAREPDIRPGAADVLKVGHHGSKSSTGDVWLDEVRPHDAVISVGAGNRYGHPAPEVLQRLGMHQATVYRTDIRGTITYRCLEVEDLCEMMVEK